eukprot:3693728-Prymnesium_polylepis.1
MRIERESHSCFSVALSAPLERKAEKATRSCKTKQNDELRRGPDACAGGSRSILLARCPGVRLKPLGRTPGDFKLTDDTSPFAP